MRPEDVINLDAYPIADMNDPARVKLVEHFRSELGVNQYVSLPDFIRPGALERAVAEATTARPHAYDNNARRNCYLHRATDPELPENHPRNLMNETSTRMIAYDLLPEGSPLRALYHWERTREFVADIVEANTLFDSEDPFQPVNILWSDPGDRSAWHFDSSNAFTMTLMLQKPETGGAFELVPNTRSDTDENYDYVRRVVSGECPGDSVQVAREPGSLCIFRGCNSIHRVSPVEGGTPRIMAVFVYETEPGVVGDPKVNATIYGPRVAAMA